MINFSETHHEHKQITCLMHDIIHILRNYMFSAQYDNVNVVARFITEIEIRIAHPLLQ